MRKNNEHGRTMMEALLYLGIIGCLAVVTLALVSSVYGKYKMDRLIRQVESLRKGINERFVSDGNYDLIDKSSSNVTVYNETIGARGDGKANSLLGENIIPSDIGTKGTHQDGRKRLVNAYGGVIDIYSVHYDPKGLDNRLDDKDIHTNAYVISFEDLSKQACAELAIMQWFSYDNSDLVKISINRNLNMSTSCDTEEFCWQRTDNVNRLLPVTMGQAAAVCNNDDSQNVINWLFY